MTRTQGCFGFDGSEDKEKLEEIHHPSQKEICLGSKPFGDEECDDDEGNDELAGVCWLACLNREWGCELLEII